MTERVDSYSRRFARRTGRFCVLGVWGGILAFVLAACSSVRTTDPPRTATEQFLLSGAAAQAVARLSFENLRGRRVWVDTQYFAASEEDFVLGKLRADMLMSGVRLVPRPEQSEVVLEVRSGGVGIDRYDFLLGLPPVLLSSDASDVAVGGVPFVTPEIAFLKNLDQQGFASVAYVAYWRETGDVVAASGPYIGTSLRDDWWYFGIGPSSRGDIPPVEGEQLE